MGVDPRTAAVSEALCRGWNQGQKDFNFDQP